MICYGDYKGPQGDVVLRDGRVVPFDRDAACEMAQHAHELASGLRERDVSVPVTNTPVSAVA